MPPATPPILIDLPDQLLGSRILLRPFRAGDGAALWEATQESREHITPWMEWIGHNRSADDSEEYARGVSARWMMREGFAFGVWDKGAERLVGQCLLIRPDWTIPSFEVGYWVRASALGNGYISESVKLVSTFAFEILGAQRVHIHCDALNHRSAAVPRRLGFIHEATLRNNERSVSGELRDTLIFALTPKDYAAAKTDWDSILRTLSEPIKLL